MFLDLSPYVLWSGYKNGLIDALTSFVLLWLDGLSTTFSTTRSRSAYSTLVRDA